MFEALSASEFAQWMTISRWAYPTFLTAHGLGMAVVVGLTSMISLRVIGFPAAVPLAAYARTIPLGIAAFFVNAASGTALFVADASLLVRNPSFIAKLIAILVGLILLWVFNRRVLKPAVARAKAGLPEAPPSGSDKALALTAIALWLLAVVTSGRFIAYLAPEF